MGHSDHTPGQTLVLRQSWATQTGLNGELGEGTSECCRRNGKGPRGWLWEKLGGFKMHCMKSPKNY